VRKFFLILIVLVGVSCSIFKSQEDNTAQSSQAKVVQGGVSRVSDSMSAEKVKKLITDSSWSIGLSQWSRSLQLSDCTETQCTLQVVFSTPQICPVGAKDDEWCDEIELSGKMQFAANGFNFIDADNAASGFCELKNDSAPDSWKLEGASCPSDLQELRGSK
jgi:hypothetical protein